MTPLNTAHAQAHPATSGAAAARCAGKGGAQANAPGGGGEPGDAFAGLMQSLVRQDAQDEDGTAATAEDSCAADPEAGPGPAAPATSATPAGLAVDPALLGAGPALPAALAAALGTEGPDGTGTPAGDAQGLVEPAATSARGTARGLAWAQPGDGRPPAIAAAQAGAGEPRPPGPARQAAGGPGTGQQPLAALPGLQVPAARGLAGAADAGAGSPVATRVSQAVAALAEDPGAKAAGPGGTTAHGTSPAGLAAFDLSALAGPGAMDLSAPAPVHQAELGAGPQDAAFAGELAAQVDVMVQGDLQQAELRLNPVDLGPIRIELRLTGNTADVLFSAAHDTTREGIARSMDQLREMLASQGLNLGQAEVGARQAGQDRQDSDAQARSSRRVAGTGGGTAAPVAVAPRPRALRGMLDLYA